MQPANVIILIVNVVILLTAVGVSVHQGVTPGPGLSWESFAAILLGSAAVIVTAVTAFIAIVAIWGYNSIREAAKEQARQAAGEQARRVAEEIARDVSATVAKREAAQAWKLFRDSVMTPAGSAGATPERADAGGREEMVDALSGEDSNDAEGSGIGRH